MAVNHLPVQPEDQALESLQRREWCVLFFVLFYYRVVVAVAALTSEVLGVCGGVFGTQVIFFFFFFLRTGGLSADTRAQHEQFVQKTNT